MRFFIGKHSITTNTHIQYTVHTRRDVIEDENRGYCVQTCCQLIAEHPIVAALYLVTLIANTWRNLKSI